MSVIHTRQAAQFLLPLQQSSGLTRLGCAANRNVSALLAITFALLLIQRSAAAITVGEAEAKRSAIVKPTPSISPIARQLKLSGSIELEVNITEAGAVETVTPLAGNPLLIESGVAAVKKWRFKPFVNSGSASRAVTKLTFEFKQ